MIATVLHGSSTFCAFPYPVDQHSARFLFRFRFDRFGRRISVGHLASFDVPGCSWKLHCVLYSNTGKSRSFVRGTICSARIRQILRPMLQSAFLGILIAASFSFSDGA